MTLRLNYSDGMDGTPGAIRVCGNFTTAGAAQPTVFSSGPFTVARTATGVFVVTFKEQFTEFLFGEAKLMDATGSAKTCYIRSGANAPSVGTASANATITIETQSVAGTVGDLTGPIVCFNVIWRKGSLRK
jgi:hypothetical protein